MSLKACSRLTMARKFLWGVPEKIQEEDRWVKPRSLAQGCAFYLQPKEALSPLDAQMVQELLRFRPGSESLLLSQFLHRWHQNAVPSLI